jgi:hypothetical protein
VGGQASDAQQEAAPEAAPDVVADAPVDALGAADAPSEAGDGAASPWGCIGSVTAPATDSNRSVTMNYEVTDIVHKPLPGMTVNVCDRTDPTCITPLIPAPLMTDAQGMVSFQVAYAARFFVEVTGPQYLKGLYYVDPPPTSSPPLTIIESLTTSGVNALAGFAPHPFNQNEGIVILLVQDCTFTPNAPAPGVQFSLATGGAGDAYAADTESFYLMNMTPDYTATMTSSDGVGGYVNAPPGFTTIAGTLVQGGTKIGQNEVVVQANTVTYATIDPYEH